MAKAATKTQEPKQQEPPVPVVTAPPGRIVLSDDIADLAEEHAGKGLSTSQADNIVPLIYILQTLSPQVKENDSEYIKGAKPGMFWLRNAPTPIVSGEEGLLVQPCFFQHDFVEWRPRTSGGGFVGRHEGVKDSKGELKPLPEMRAQRTPDPQNPNKIKLLLPNGNELIETRSHIIRVKTPDGNIMPYIIAFSSTGHTSSRQWMTHMNNQIAFRPDGTQVKVSSFQYWWRLTTKERSNAMGDWYVVEDQFESVATKDEVIAAAALHDAFVSGAKEAEAPQATQAAGKPSDLDDEIPF